MQTKPSKTSILANEPGAFQVEVQCASEADAASLGLHSQEGETGVLLTLASGDKDISLQLCPDDIPRLREALDLCDQWASIEEAAQIAESDVSASEPGY